MLFSHPPSQKRANYRAEWKVTEIRKEMFAKSQPKNQSNPGHPGQSAGLSPSPFARAWNVECSSYRGAQTDGTVQGEPPPQTTQPGFYLRAMPF